MGMGAEVGGNEFTSSSACAASSMITKSVISILRTIFLLWIVPERDEGIKQGRGARRAIPSPLAFDGTRFFGGIRLFIHYLHDRYGKSFTEVSYTHILFRTSEHFRNEI